MASAPLRRRTIREPRPSFSDAVAQVADARVFAGFHFRFSCDDAAQMGRQVAHYAGATLMRRLDGEEERS